MQIDNDLSSYIAMKMSNFLEADNTEGWIITAIFWL